MNVQQIYQIANTITKEVLGSEAVVSEDLSNIVDIGTEIYNANKVDNYVKSLVDVIGRVIFVSRPYSGKMPNVLMDAWEFGSVLEKINCDLPQATENDTWTLQNGKSYSQDVFYKPTVSAKFFNSKVTFEIPLSITDRQIRESFANVAQLNGFYSMIYNAVDKSFTIKLDALIQRTINNMIMQTATDGNANRYVNLLSLYNNALSKSLTVAKAIYDPDFIRFASYTISKYVDKLASISTLFNIGGKERFTNKDNLNLVLLSDFARACEVYLYSDIKNKDYVMLPNYTSVAFWQGSGTNYDFADVSKIINKTGTTEDDADVNTTVSGIIGVMFDRDAVGVANLNRRVTSSYNAKAEFYNNFYKMDAGFFNDTNENFIVFYVA